MSDAQDVALLPPPPLPEIIQRYCDGETIEQLALESRRSRQTIWNWMLAGLGDAGHEQVVTQCLVNRIAEADEQLDNAASGLDLARAREKAKLSRMDFERRRPKLYGAQTQLNSNVAIQVIIQRDTPQQAVVDVAKAENVA